MTLTFLELEQFSAIRDDRFGDDEGYRQLQNYLLVTPLAGEVIPGAGGIRKMRWFDPRRGKGKRGSLRVIYLHMPEIPAIVFFTVYDKDKATDLTPEQNTCMQ